MAGLLDLLSSRGNALPDMPHGAADAHSRNEMAASGILGRMLGGMDNPAPTYDQRPPGGFFVRSSARPIDLQAELSARRALGNQPTGRLETYNPTWRDWLGDRGADAARALGLGPIKAQEMRDNVKFIADMAPLTGALLAGEDGGRAYNAGDYPGMAMAAAGVIPGGKLIGRMAKKASPTMAARVVNDVISELPMDENLASRVTTIYDFPVVNRPFSADYPNGAAVNDAGKLFADIDGRPFNADARFVAGRRVVGDPEEALGPQELVALGEAGTGRRIETVAPRAIGGDAGQVKVNRYTRQPEQVFISKELSSASSGRVIGHEVGHVIDQTLRELPNPQGKVLRELKLVYNEGNNTDLAQARSRGYDIEKNPRKVYRGVTPEALNYEPHEVPREYWSEGFRAYMTSPGWFKSVAPEAAAIIRRHVNNHPKLRDLIQFNGIAAATAPLGLMSYLAAQQDEQ